MKMRIRLARKIIEHRNRYSVGKWIKAALRLGYKPFVWKVAIETHGIEPDNIVLRVS